MTATKQARSITELFGEVAGTTKWGTIEDYVTAVRGNDELKAMLLTGDVETRALKQAIRQYLRQTKNEHGHSAFASIRTQDAEGNPVVQYKQETLFNVEDYQQVANFHSQRVIHHAQEATYYKRQCHAKFNEQIPLAFDERAILLD